MTEIITVVDKERLALALNALIRSNLEDSPPWIKMQDKYLLDCHPLGLQIPNSLSSQERTVYFLTFPNTEPSVTAMCRVIMFHMTDAQFGGKSTYFRINRCEAGPGYERDHQAAGSWVKYDYIFEFGWGCWTFLCGGCNNHTGESGWGGRQLEAVFDLCSSMLGIPVMEAIIPEKQWEELEPKLHTILREQDEARHAA